MNESAAGVGVGKSPVTRCARAVLMAYGLFAAVEAAAASCEPPVARLVSLQGTVETQRSGQPVWAPAALDERLCFGDRLRTRAASRAALALPDETVTRLDQNTVIHFPPPADEKKTWLEVLEGALHIVTRDRRALRVLTPFANAGIDGTEFLVTVSAGDASILVFEGQVTMENASGRASAGSGTRVSAGAGAAPVLATVVRPRDAVQWTLYYPPVTAGASDEAGRAAAALAVGRFDDAERLLDAALRKNSTDAVALALRSIMALTQNDRERARSLAGQAVAADPASAAALIARSYVQQSDFDLGGALQSLQAATAAEPGNVLAAARLAELWLAVGDTRQAIDAARDAVAADPALSLPHAVLGFAYLARVDTALARASFTEAIRLDSAAPLPRLGLGLALIRDGELTAGREQIDIAVILDPGNALIRAYIGKAYYEEKRDELAATQLGIAKELDPNDPTAFFYDAIRKQTVNRPVEALEDMTESVALNDNRAVYRSRLLLDEDLAARSAAVGRTYRDLSFDELALRKGWKSVATDPSDFSGHRLLADSYSSLPRHEIARVNELLQSQLLQPLNITPVQPQLGEANLFILDTAGPTAISFNEFNPLFNRDRLAIQSSAVVGGNDTWGADAVVAGIDGPWSASLGGYHFETDGFRENNDLEQSVGSLLVQRRLSADTSVLAEVRATDREEGDLVLRAKEPPFPSTGRASDDSATVRIGLRHDFSPSTTGLALIAYEDVSLANFSSVGSFRIAQDVDNYTAELQVLHRAVNWSLTSGVRYYGSTVDENTTLLIPIPDPPFEIPVQDSDGFRPQDISGYAYANFALPANVVLTAGASIDLLEGRNFERDRFNPKLGVVWQPTTDTTVRLAAFQTLQRPNPSRLDIQPSLEPTPVAGFNQFFAGSEAEEARRLGLGIDHRLSGELQAGLEISRRWLDIPFFEQTPPPDVSLRTVTTDVTESQARGYLYWLASDRISAGASYEYDLFENDANFFPFGYLTLETHRLPLEASYFHPSGFSAGVVATGVWQRGDFQVFPFAPTERDSDDFWVADAFAAFRLPGRHGVIRIEAQNLFDRSIQFQDVDPQNPRIFPERTILLRATIAY